MPSFWPVEVKQGHYQLFPTNDVASRGNWQCGGQGFEPPQVHQSKIVTPARLLTGRGFFISPQILRNSGAWLFPRDHEVRPRAVAQ